jgi:pilus assembly protein CpaB
MHVEAASSGRRPLLVALVLALLGGAAAYAAIRAQEAEVRGAWATVRVLCAARDLAAGVELDRDMIAVREIPARFATASFLPAGPGATSKDAPVGQRLLVPVKAGDPLLEGHFAPALGAGLSTLVEAKGRAVAIDVQERSAVGLWVRPGDHVDVVGSLRDPDSQQLKTVTLLQNVVVLATGHATANNSSIGEDERRYSTVTLLVLPEEAEILALAQETGTLTLSLRNPDDVEFQEKRSVVDQRQLLTGDRAFELRQKRYRTIQIIRGAPGTARIAGSGED